jgi:hypothetical protein
VLSYGGEKQVVISVLVLHTIWLLFVECVCSEHKSSKNISSLCARLFAVAVFIGCINPMLIKEIQHKTTILHTMLFCFNIFIHSHLSVVFHSCLEKLSTQTGTIVIAVVSDF